ncbi:MAG: hypothetical protein IT385_00115 [Deltaproteobacteria bacterium]|nr:hypothetical protein [Deltaproteobacteria bacterium]
MRHTITTALPVAALLLGACGDDGVTDDTGAPLRGLVAEPTFVDFDEVPADVSVSRTVSLRNVGREPVRITTLHLSGPTAMSVTVHGVTHVASATTSRDGIAVSPPIEIAPGGSAPIELGYRASHRLEAQGNLRVVTDLPGDPGVHVPIVANALGPCIEVRPRALDLGGRPVGEAARGGLVVKSCAGRPLALTSASITDSGGGVFALDPETIDAWPLLLEAGQSTELGVVYTPTTVASAVDIFDRGRLTIVSSSPSSPEVAVDLVGFGTERACATARITCNMGTSVAPGTTVHCSADASTSASGGPVAGLEWSLRQPAGSIELVRPSATQGDVTFTTNVLGAYTVVLEVFDEDGSPGCRPAERELAVGHEDDAVIELVWRTPGDADEGDSGYTLGGSSVGSDLDLHLLHESGAAWFDPQWDTYWLQPSPSWGSAGERPTSPRMLRDDVDGAGPELVHLPTTSSSSTSTIGVHYWDDWGYGPAFATVRVYVRGALVFEWADVELVTQDLWSVAEIDWPSGEVRALGDGRPAIEAGYPVPLGRRDGF